MFAFPISDKAAVSVPLVSELVEAGTVECCTADIRTELVVWRLRGESRFSVVGNLCPVDDVSVCQLLQNDVSAGEDTELVS